MDTDADGRWMTYEELANARGIDRQSARRLASRLKWRRQKDNRQVVRVYVPSERAVPQRGKRNTSADTSGAISADISIAVRSLESAVTTLPEQLERERSRADQAEARATSALALLRGAAETLKTEQAAKAAAEAKAAELQEAVEAKAAELQQTIDALREEAAHAAAQAKEVAHRPALVASKIDEVQFRRLQEADEARKSLGLLARLRAAWRGE
jgi:chromosome segregation ATPase